MMYWLKWCCLPLVGMFRASVQQSSETERTVSPCQWFLWPGDDSCWVSRHQHRPQVRISLILFSSLGGVFRSWFTLWWDLAEADFPLAASSFPFSWGNPQVSLTCSANPLPFPQVLSLWCCTVKGISEPISHSDTSQTLFFLPKSL